MEITHLYSQEFPVLEGRQKFTFSIGWSQTSNYRLQMFCAGRVVYLFHSREKEGLNYILVGAVCSNPIQRVLLHSLISGTL